MYPAIVLLLMLIFPAVSVGIERHTSGGAAGWVALIGRWFVFWGVGVRLFLAGVRQVVNPRYTAEVILGLKTPEPLVVIRELGFANLAIGAVAAASIVARSWLTPAALAGAIFYGLAGIYHIGSKERNGFENIALVSDLFACCVCCVYLMRGV